VAALRDCDGVLRQRTGDDWQHVAADSAISAGTDYFWRPVYTDHVAQTVNGNVIPGRLWDEVPLILSFIGDSWTTSAHCNGVVSYVSKVAGHLRKVTLGRNEGIGGTGVVTWDPSSGLYDGSLDAALPRLIAAGTQVISLLMGTNDVSNSTSASEWSTRLVNICNYMFAHGLPDVKVVLHCPAFRNGSGATGEQLLLEYRNILPSVCNGRRPHAATSQTIDRSKFDERHFPLDAGGRQS
jgi:hypothetical protein